MSFEQNRVTREFIETVEFLLDRGIVKNYKELADTLKWNQSSMYAVMNKKRNVPFEIAQEFNTLAEKLVIECDNKNADKTSNSYNSAYEEKFLEIESQLKVITTYIIELKQAITKNSTSEISAEIEEAIKKVKKVYKENRVVDSTLYQFKLLQAKQDFEDISNEDNI